jgi:lipopolysaccharide export system protein LptC
MKPIRLKLMDVILGLALGCIMSFEVGLWAGMAKQAALTPAITKYQCQHLKLQNKLYDR